MSSKVYFYSKYEEYIRHQMSELAAQKEIESAEEKGRTQGREEEKIEIARKMLKGCANIAFISSVTGLDKKLIEKLYNSD